MIKQAEQRILEMFDGLSARLHRPVVIAIDGGSGAGKTTLAARIAAHRPVALVPLDDFYQTRIPETTLRAMSVEDRLQAVFDWGRVRRDAIEPLRIGQPGKWHALDFAKGLGTAGTYCLQEQVTEVRSAPMIVLEGAYSASPPLRDAVDLTILVCVESPLRRERLALREQGNLLDNWHALWDAVEAYYFGQVCPPSSFDLVVSNSGATLR